MLANVQIAHSGLMGESLVRHGLPGLPRAVQWEQFLDRFKIEKSCSKFAPIYQMGSKSDSVKKVFFVHGILKHHPC